MKMISLWQPWAQLVVQADPSLECEHFKWIETRPWSTTYRGPLLIHAAKVQAHYWEATNNAYRHGSATPEHALVNGIDSELLELVGDPVPFGAAVAVCDLVDCIPMVDRWPNKYEPSEVLYAGDHHPLSIVGDWKTNRPGRNVEDQRPFGDFAPGRFGLLLENVRRLDPIPVERGSQGRPIDVPGPVLVQVLARLEAA